MTKLYVGNLAEGATEHALRTHFASCGGVADVEILTHPRTGRPRGLAVVTMTSQTFADAALRRLDGADFDGRPLRISERPIRAEDGPRPSKVKIAQQFRERTNMTYELDCAGAPLIVRVFPTDDDRWRIEARTSDRDDATVITGAAATRREALADVARGWREHTASMALPVLDWDAVTTAMSDVRAV